MPKFNAFVTKLIMSRRVDKKEKPRNLLTTGVKMESSVADLTTYGGYNLAMLHTIIHSCIDLQYTYFFYR